MSGDHGAVLAQLSGILIDTYNPDQGRRAGAEAMLQQFLNTPGSVGFLLALVSSKEAVRDLRLAAALIMKNNVKDFWRSAEDRAKRAADGIVMKTRSLAEDEREGAKTSLLEIMLSETDSAVRKSVAETLKQISERDVVGGDGAANNGTAAPASPNTGSWPACVPTLLGGITSGDPLRIFNALTGLRQIMKQYQFVGLANNPLYTVRRRILDDVIQQAFPVLQGLCNQINQLPPEQASLEAASILHMCLKIFYSVTAYELPQGVTGVDVPFWFSLLAAQIGKPLPEASTGLAPTGQPTSDEQRKAWPWWKVKKWATKIAQHIFTRFGNPRSAKEEDMAFTAYFKDHLSLLLLQPILGTLQDHAQGGYITDDVHRSCLTYLTCSIELSATYKALVPHLEYLVGTILLPALAITPGEETLFRDDPVEFVRKTHNIMEGFTDPKVQAQNALQSLARYRNKACMPLIVAQLEASCMRYQSLPEAPPGAAADPNLYRDHRSKDAAIVAFAACIKSLLDKKNDKYRAFVSAFLERHVLPEFASPVPFLRARACWCMEYLENYRWGIHDPAVLQAACHGLLQGLRDLALPVQAAAACSFRVLIDTPNAPELIRPVLPQVIGEFFRISRDIESDAVLSALQAIVRAFGEEVGTIAPTMVQTLLGQFQEYANAGMEDDEAQFAASEVLDTIVAVLEAVESRPDILLSLEPQLLPAVHNIISSEEGYEYIETAMEIIFYLSGGGKHISENLMQLCGPLLLSLGVQAYSLIDVYCGVQMGGDIPLPIHYYISSDPVRFLQTIAAAPAPGADGYVDFSGDTPVSGVEPTPLVGLLLSLVNKAFVSDTSENEREARSACSLLLTLVGSCRGNQMIHSLLPAILNLVLGRLFAPACPDPAASPWCNTKTKTLKVRLLEICMCCLYYNADATLTVLLSDPAKTEAFFQLLFASLTHMEGPITQRLIVTSFSSVLAASPDVLNRLPDIVKGQFAVMIRQCMNELDTLKENAWDIGVKEEEEDDEDWDGDFDDDDDDEIDLDDEDEEEEGGEARESSARAAQRRLAVPDGGYGEDEDVINAEDESYLAVLDGAVDREVSRGQRYIGGEPVDEEDDEGRCSGTPMDAEDVLIFFVDAIMSRQHDASYAAAMQAALGPEGVASFTECVKLAAERRQEAGAAAAAAGAAATTAGAGGGKAAWG